MKRILVGILVLGMMLAFGSVAQAERIYALNLSEGPMIKGGTSTFVLTSPLGFGGKTGVTVIERPYEKGEKWSLQVGTGTGVTGTGIGVTAYTTGVSIVVAGQTGATTYEGIGYRISLYFANYLDGTQTGGSVYQLPTVYMTGTSTVLHTITVPPARYMWARITELGGTSAFYNFPIYLYPINQGI